jgi:hypothetical protein
MAVPICLDPTVGLPSIEDYKQCIFYLAEVASEVLRMHYRKALGRQQVRTVTDAGPSANHQSRISLTHAHQDEELELDFDDMEGAANKEENVDPDLIFSVPIAIMDSILFAELRKGDTPPLAAEKFCTTNLESLTVRRGHACHMLMQLCLAYRQLFGSLSGGSCGSRNDGTR